MKLLLEAYRGNVVAFGLALAAIQLLDWIGVICPY